jgi:hypothetical protein
MMNMFKIAIPEPCTQKWGDLQPNGCGRFCASCEKTVMDFTGMDDLEFIRYFQYANTIPCGRFTERQLTLDIPPSPLFFSPFKKWSKYVAASMITATAMSATALAQQANTVQTTTDKQNNKNGQANKEQMITIRGNVIDETGEIVVGALVSINHLELKTNTDLDGNFTLSFPKAWQKYNTTLSLTVSFLGSEKVMLLLKPEELKTIEVRLQPSILGGPVYYKPNNWKRFKYWVKNNIL